MFGAFISYKRQDEAFAIALEKALERYVPPQGLGLPRTRLNVFRDRDDITGTEYFKAIERSLAASSALVVICSPHARKSSYIDDEIRTLALVLGLISEGLLALGGNIGGANVFVYGIRVVKRPDTPLAEALNPLGLPAGEAASPERTTHREDR